MRLSTRCALAVAVVVLAAGPARAQEFGRGWFERMSGPGSFRGTELGFPTVCLWKKADNTYTFVPYWESPQATHSTDRVGNDDDGRVACLDAGVGVFSNADRETAGLISLRHIEARFIIPLERFDVGPIDLGFLEGQVGVGALRFQGSGFQHWRFTFSPQIVLKPLKLIPGKPGTGLTRGKPNRQWDWRDILQFPLGAIWISHIDNEDLLATGFPPFEHGWLTRTSYFVIDFSQVFGLR
jgi:hypothetical protein